MGANESNERLINDQYLLSELSSSRVTHCGAAALGKPRLPATPFFPFFFSGQNATDGRRDVEKLYRAALRDVTMTLHLRGDFVGR